MKMEEWYVIYQTPIHLHFVFQFCNSAIHVSEYRSGNQNRTIQRNWQHRAHKTMKNKTKLNTLFVGHHYAQASTNNVNKTWALLQTTGGKPNRTSFYAEIIEDFTTRNSERRDNKLLDITMCKHTQKHRIVIRVQQYKPLGQHCALYDILGILHIKVKTQKSNNHICCCYDKVWEI